MAVVLYPIDPESDVVLRDGPTVRMRPVREDYAEGVLARFAELSEQSLYHRFEVSP